LIFYGVFAIFLLITFFLILYIRNQNVVWQQRKQFQETEIAQQKELLSAVIESQEIERKRIGEDLHDEIGSTLSAIKLMLGSLRKKDETVQEVIVPAKELIDKMIIDVRNIAHDLSPPGLSMFGFFHAIESFTTLINNTGEIDITISQNPDFDKKRLPEKDELALFRIITQLIANTLKHAEATKIELNFDCTATRFNINYTDNGKGFNQAILKERKGIGMQNIFSRLQMINAIYTLDTGLNQGFKMHIEIC
jgi:signal transduction histidine kinase